MESMTRREVIAKGSAAATLLALPPVLAACGGSGGGSANRLPSDSVQGSGTNAAIPSLTWALASAMTTLDVATGNSFEGTL